MTLARSRFAAVILAAGFSSRMGDFKTLMDLAGQTVLARFVGTFRAAGVGDVVVVTGHRASKVQAGVESLGVSSIHNPAYEQGMFSSVRAAVSSLSGLDAFFLLPVDIALVRSATIASLIQASDGRIAYPCFEGERGHPPLVPAGLIPAILDHYGGGGMKSLLEAHPDLDVPVWDQGALNVACCRYSSENRLYFEPCQAYWQKRGWGPP
jgi:molybdenum cofactor cytidylyltransferase